MKVQLLSIKAALIAGVAFFGTTNLQAAPHSTDWPIVSKLPFEKGTESFSIELKPLVNSSTIQLVIQKSAGKKVWITFKAPDGETIERFLTAKDAMGVLKNYNFLGADEGTYSFEITDGKKSETKFVTLETSTPKTTQLLILK